MQILEFMTAALVVLNIPARGIVASVCLADTDVTNNLEDSVL